MLVRRVDHRGPDHPSPRCALARSSISLLAVLAIVSFAALACGDEADQPEADPVIAATATASAVDLIVIGCRVEPVRGVGAMVADGSGNPYILTAAHVVAGSTSIVVTTADRSTHAATGTLVALDPINDLALLRVPLPLPALPLAENPALAGDRGAVVVFDEGAARALPYEIISRASVGIVDIYGRDRSKRSGYRVDIDIELGDSGAVLVDRAGRAAGVLYAKSITSDGSAFATDTSSIHDLADDAALAEPSRGIDSGPCAVP